VTAFAPPWRRQGWKIRRNVQGRQLVKWQLSIESEMAAINRLASIFPGVFVDEMLGLSIRLRANRRMFLFARRFT
jgi:hypothetical protein